VGAPPPPPPQPRPGSFPVFLSPSRIPWLVLFSPCNVDSPLFQGHARLLPLGFDCPLPPLRFPVSPPPTAAPPPFMPGRPLNLVLCAPYPCYRPPGTPSPLFVFWVVVPPVFEHSGPLPGGFCLGTLFPPPPKGCAFCLPGAVTLSVHRLVMGSPDSQSPPSRPPSPLLPPMSVLRVYWVPGSPSSALSILRTSGPIRGTFFNLGRSIGGAFYPSPSARRTLHPNLDPHSALCSFLARCLQWEHGLVRPLRPNPLFSLGPSLNVQP